MNKVNILSIVFAGICAFSACTDDKDPVINDLKDSEGNNISFTLNAPNNSSYTLMPENARVSSIFLPVNNRITVSRQV